MLTNKNQRRTHFAIWLLVAAMVWAGGCMPAGPRALLRGKRLVEQGKYADAIEELKEATSQIPTNAQAWNYLGLAYHHAGQSADAIDAYNRAHRADPDLAIVHYNLGCLLLEMNRPDTLDAARNELTAYTLHQRNSADAWVKLGTAQMRLSDWFSAESSLKQALQIQQQNVEAINDLGVILMQRRRTRDAVAYFNSALQIQPGYGPAQLNLAIAEIYLNNRPLALQKYQDYLALNPHAANWQAVNAIAQQLDAELNPRPVITNNVVPLSPTTNIARTDNVATNPPRTSYSQPTRTTEPVHVAENPATYQTPPPPHQPSTQSVAPATPKTSGQTIGEPPDEATDTAPPRKKGFLQRIFGHSDTTAPETSTTPSPTANPSPSVENGAVPVLPATPVHAVSVPRYPYLPAQHFAPGNRAQAERMVTAGAAAQREGRLKDAIDYFRAAAAADPGFFDAQSSLGAAEAEAEDLGDALRAYELALADDPNSFTARFNFGQLLKRANYIQDAAQQLEQLAASHPPDESPERMAVVHLTLGNLYAEQFHQNDAARKHYLKVLELDPQNSQATSIRFWLRNNP